MKFVVILLSLLQISVAVAASKKVAKLPSYTPNNPYGKWTALPNGNNYLFCGDRIIYGSSFNEKIKIQYNGEDRLMTIREHCEMRRRELERAVAGRTSEEPPLIQLQYEKLAGYLKKLPGGTKAGRIYSLKEIRKAMKANEVNDLRAANLMLPVLTEPEFAKLYASDTNNPQFTKTEHERYISNLMTQNPAMLYTANGSLFYFSLNLSNDQLKLLASVVGSGGGGGAGSGGGSGGRGSSAPGNSETANNRRQINNALEGARQNPFEGSKLASNLNVRPQATTLPASFGVESDATFVPYDMKMPSVSIGPTRGVASSGSGRNARADRVKAVTVSSNPSLGMMNIGGMGGGRNAGSGGGGGTSGGSSSGGYEAYSSKSSGVSSTTGTTGNARAAGTGQANKINPDLDAGSDRSVVLARGPAPILLVGNDWSKTSCEPQKWAANLYAASQYGFGNDFYKNAKGGDCLASSENQYCGEGKVGDDYKNKCMKGSNQPSCYKQAETDIKSICKEYIQYNDGYELSEADIFVCAETMMALACQKIPCDLNYDEKNDEALPILYQVNGESPLFEKQEDSFTNNPIISLKNIDLIGQIPYVKQYNSEKAIKYSTGGFVDYSLLKKEGWPSSKQGDFLKRIAQLSTFYKVHYRTTTCKKQSNGSSNPEDGKR